MRSRPSKAAVTRAATWCGSRRRLDSRSSLTDELAVSTLGVGRPPALCSKGRRAARAVRVRSIAATARGHRVEPISLYGLVSPEIDGHFHRRLEPYELLVEIEFGAYFLEPREADLEISRRAGRAARCIDGHLGGPATLQRRRLHR